MIDPTRERAGAGNADAAIAEGEGRIARQTALIVELERDRHDTTAARKYLAALHAALAAWRAIARRSSG